jgi:hypothetical protein
MLAAMARAEAAAAGAARCDALQRQLDEAEVGLLLLRAGFSFRKIKAASGEALSRLPREDGLLRRRRCCCGWSPHVAGLQPCLLPRLAA